MRTEVLEILQKAYSEFGNDIFGDNIRLNSCLRDLLFDYPIERKKLSIAVNENLVSRIIKERNPERFGVYVDVLKTTYDFPTDTSRDIVSAIYYAINVEIPCDATSNTKSESLFDEVVSSIEKTIDHRNKNWIGGRYELLEIISNDINVISYKAKCHILNREVEIDILQNIIEEHGTDKCVEFGAKVAKLAHNNLAQTYDCGIEQGKFYVVREHVMGTSISESLSLGAEFEEEEVASYLKQILNLVAYLHKNNVSNLGISSKNIFITKDGIKFKLPICGENWDCIYTSPEKARGGYVSDKSDIYLIGVLIYELSVGKPPFQYEDSDIGVALKHIQELPVAPQEYKNSISNGLNNLIMNMLEKNASSREDIKTLEDNVERLQNGTLDMLEYTVKLIRKSLMPFKIDVYVDEKLYAVQVDEKEYDLVLPIGNHNVIL